MVGLTDRPDMILDVYRGRKTTMQQQQQLEHVNVFNFPISLKIDPYVVEHTEPRKGHFLSDIYQKRNCKQGN